MAGLLRRLAFSTKASRLLVAAVLFGFSVLVYAETLALTPIKDNTLFQDNPNYSSGISSFTFVGPIASGSPRRTLWQFDLTTVPPGSQITSATLSFEITKAAFSSSPDDVLSLHRLTASWGEGTSDGGTGGGGTQATAEDATWGFRFFGNPGLGIPQVPWASLGGDFSPVVSAAINAGGTGVYTFTSTEELKADIAFWVNNPSTNFGWILIGPEGDSFSQKAKRIISRESPSITQRPTLTINYTLPPERVVSAPMMSDFLTAILGLSLVLIGFRPRRYRRISKINR